MIMNYSNENGMINGTFAKIGSTASTFIPNKIKVWIEQKLIYAGYNKDKNQYLGIRLTVIFLFGVIGFLAPLVIGRFAGMIDNNLIIYMHFSNTFIQMNVLLLSAIFAICVMMLIFIIYISYLNYIISARTKLVEKSLPDFLSLVANNISAGMTTYAAFKSCARPEFGPLSEEIKTISAKSLGDISFTDALKDLTARINSKALKETQIFLSRAIQSGGKLAKLLENIAKDIRDAQELKKEMNSATKMYVLFVIFIMLVATPVLLGVSLQFLKIIENIQTESAVSTLSSNEIAGIGSMGQGANISPETMFLVSIILLLINSILASIFIGIIREGNAKQSISYFPVLFIISFIVYFAATKILPLILPL